MHDTLLIDIEIFIILGVSYTRGENKRSWTEFVLIISIDFILQNSHVYYTHTGNKLLPAKLISAHL